MPWLKIECDPMLERGINNTVCYFLGIELKFISNRTRYSKTNHPLPLLRPDNIHVPVYIFNNPPPLTFGKFVISYCSIWDFF